MVIVPDANRIAMERSRARANTPENPAIEVRVHPACQLIDCCIVIVECRGVIAFEVEDLAV